MFAVWASPLDAGRVLDDPGGSIAVVAVDRLLEKVGHGTPHSRRRGWSQHFKSLLGPLIVKAWQDNGAQELQQKAGAKYADFQYVIAVEATEMK
jgi:hypothetical protein